MSYTNQISYPTEGQYLDINLKAMLRWRTHIIKKLLKNLVDVPWYLESFDIHGNLEMDAIRHNIFKFAKSHEQQLNIYVISRPSHFMIM